MYEYVSQVKRPFTFVDAYNQIAGCAFRFEALGHENIWIYLKDGDLTFSNSEVVSMREFFVAHPSCKKVTQNFSKFEWDRLGRKLVRVHLKSK